MQPGWPGIVDVVVTTFRAATIGRFSRRARAACVVAVLHPKGDVGRSTTVWQLGAELALRGKRVRIEDLDQGRHLSRVY